jgi:endonuclease/exonuclease/phosphatase family metal-dependent hydrolase
VESWSGPEENQPELVARRLGFEHSMFTGDWRQEDWISGIGLVSRWPVTAHERRALSGEDGPGAGCALFALVEGARGPLQLFVVMLDYRLDASPVRHAQVLQLAEFIQERTRHRHPIVVCGDFNAGPDADELRVLTGRTGPARPGLVFYDAWEIAGDGTPGHTWSNRNPLAAVALFPDGAWTMCCRPGLGAAGRAIRRGASVSVSSPRISRSSPTTTGYWRTCATN